RLCVSEEVSDAGQRCFRNGRLHFGDDLGDVWRKLGPRVFRRLLGYIVFGRIALAHDVLDPAQLAFGVDAVPVSAKLPVELDARRAVGVVDLALYRCEAGSKVRTDLLAERDTLDRCRTGERARQGENHAPARGLACRHRWIGRSHALDLK